jgi:hypothetical protein
MVSTFNVSVVAYTTLLSAIFGFFVQTYRTGSSNLGTPFCYLFLAPGLLVVMSFAIIRAYRASIFRLAYYLLIFFEKEFGGAGWHLNLIEYRKTKSAKDRETGNSFSLILWTLLIISVGLFTFTLVLVHARPWHFGAPLPLIFSMIFQQRDFLRVAQRIEKNWHTVKAAQPALQNRNTMST